MILKSWFIQNFKPILDSGELKLAPVTVLAGRNSSGKSSLIQSILMIAQTLSSRILDRALLPNGPIVQLGTDALDLWTKGEQGIIYAINQQYKKDWSDTITSPFEFRLGPRFIESVNERGLDTNEIVLRSFIRAASDVIADKAKDRSGYNLHAFRESETADSPQLIRDSDRARAWRLMLQKRGAGWRLHY